MDRLKISKKVDQLRNMRDYRQFNTAVNLIADVIDDILAGVIDAHNQADETDEALNQHMDMDHD